MVKTFGAWSLVSANLSLNSSVLLTHWLTLRSSLIVSDHYGVLTWKQRVKLELSS